MKLTKYIFILLLLFTQGAFSQDYPCQVMVNMSPPYPLTLSGYGSSIQEKINLTLLLGDISESGREVGLKFYIEGSSGFRAGSGDIVTGTSPLVLEGGVPLYLTQSDLSPYFRFENLQGLNPQAYGALLPEGMYQFCFEVYDWQSKRVISARSCAGAQLQGNSPPVLNLPSRGEYVVQQEPQNLIFQWSPMHINVPNVEYEFTLVELWDTGMDPGAAFLSGRPLYQVTTLSPTLLYGPSEPALLQGRNYAWRVRAVVWDGAEEADYFYNKGYSETFHFSYASPCSPPSGLRDASNNSSMSHKLNWFKTHQRYHVQYRKKNPAADAWFEVGPLSTHLREDDIDEELILYNLEGGKTYEYRVGGSCVGTGNRGGYVYSDIHEFTTRSRDSTGTYNCGEISGVELKGEAPLERLGSNEVFTAGDYPVTAKEVYGGQGSYTGWGYMPIPYLRDTKIKVYFEGIRINSNHQLMEGVLKTEYDEEWEGVMQGLNVEFPEEEQAETEAEAQAVVNSTATVTGSETGTTTEAGEEDEPMAYEEDPYELFEDITEEETTEETTAETQAGTSGANDAANSATSGQGTGNINTPLEVQDNQLPDDQILASTAPGDEKLIDESGKIYKRDDVIYVDCSKEGYKEIRLIKGDYGASPLEVVWDISYTNYPYRNSFSEGGLEFFKLGYGQMRTWTEDDVRWNKKGIIRLNADYGSGHITVLVECVPPDPIIIKYQGVNYYQEETINLDCRKGEHVFELLGHDPAGEEFINWELTSLNGATIYKTENGTGTKFTLDRIRLLQARGEFPQGIYQLIVHHNFTSYMVYIACVEDVKLDPLLIAQNTPAGNLDATTDTPAYLNEEVELAEEDPLNPEDPNAIFENEEILGNGGDAGQAEEYEELNVTMEEVLDDTELDLTTKLLWITVLGINQEAVNHISSQPATEIVKAFGNSNENVIKDLGDSPVLMSALFNKLDNNDFAKISSIVTLIVPPTVNDRDNAGKVALRVLNIQLQSKTIARKFIEQNMKVVVIPRHMLITEVEEFSHLVNHTTPVGIPVAQVRGYKKGELIAVPEEDLLGGNCTATYEGKRLLEPYPDGNSTTSHEIAHGIHGVLDGNQKAIITTAFNNRKKRAMANPNDPGQWVTGREGSYASINREEFFALLSNAYLGVNIGIDYYTKDPLHNGKEWVRNNEPEIYKLLETLYGQATLKGIIPGS